MRFLKYALYGMISVVVLLLATAFFLPSTYSVDNSITIGAKAEDVFPYVSDLRRWQTWNAWMIKNAGLEFKFSEVSDEVGSSYVWREDRGAGIMRLVDKEKPDSLKFALAYESQPANEILFTFEQLQDSTRVTWSMSGDVGGNPISKLFILFANNIIGKDQKEGLQRLKELVEQGN